MGLQASVAERETDRTELSTDRAITDRMAPMLPPVLDVHLVDGLADRMLQYMVTRSIADRVEGCLISGAVLPEWGIAHPNVPGAPGPELMSPVCQKRRDVAWISDLLSSGVEPRVSVKSGFCWLPSFPDVEACRDLFRAEEDKYPGYGDEYLVCNIESLAGKGPQVLLPLDFYEELARTTGRKLVFMGLSEENAYCNALKKRFSDAIFHCSRGAMGDFQTFRNCKNLIVACNTFSWLAAWLSRANMVVLPVNGMFHPANEPYIDLLPSQDERYGFYLFPINFTVPVERFEEAHRTVNGGWRYVNVEAISGLRHARPLEPFVRMFDEAFYLDTYQDVARVVKAGGFKNGLDHYTRFGFVEGRGAFPFDARWYGTEYPIAAYEVGQGDYADLMHHFAEVGFVRGYRPVPFDKLPAPTIDPPTAVREHQKRTASRQYIADRDTLKITLEESVPFDNHMQFEIGPYLKDLDKRKQYPSKFSIAKETNHVEYCVIDDVVLDGENGALFKEGVHIGEAFFRGKAPHHPYLDPKRIVKQPVTNTVILGFNAWYRNYFHWITQSIPAIYWGNRACKDPEPLLALPALAPWQEQALSLAGMSSCKRCIIDPRRQYAVARLAYMTLTLGTEPQRSRKAVEVFRQMRSKIQLAPGPANSVIYVSRKDSDNRVLTNESELCDLLTAEGVEILIPGRLSLEEQIKEFSKAKAVIGPHGAGLTNLIFCEPGATLYELIPDLRLIAYYADLAQMLGLNYWAEAFACHPVKDEKRIRTSWAWQVDVQEVLRRARSLLEKPPIERGL